MKYMNLPKRLRYYQGNMDLDLIKKGEDYKKLSKSYIIFICTFDMFKKGRHKYTFQSVCVEDNSISLEDETNKIILNTTGVINDLSDELIQFLNYVEHSNDETAAQATGSLVKNIHKQVVKVKNDPDVEVEFMTLLERDREKFEEGIEQGIEKGETIALAKTASKLLKKKFGSLPEGLEESISKLDVNSLEKIIDNILDFEDIEEIRGYLK